MVFPGNLLLLLLLPAEASSSEIGGRQVAFLATAQMAEGSCFGCGSLPLWLLLGLVATDAAVSLLIVVVVFSVFSCCRPRQRPPQDGKIYINLPGRG